MTLETGIWIWFIVGVILIALEFFIPGAILSFLGMGAVIVAGLLYFKLITGFLQSFIAWFIISIILVLFLRSFLLKFMPSLKEKQETSEEEFAKGSLVEVLEDTSPFSPGRIRFRDTTWESYSDHQFKKGDSAKIVRSQNNGWVIGPIDK